MTPFEVCESTSGLICLLGRSVAGEVGGCLRLLVPFCSIGREVFIGGDVWRERLPRECALKLDSLVKCCVRKRERGRDAGSGRVREGVARKLRLQAASETRPSSMPIGMTRVNKGSSARRLL